MKLINDWRTSWKLSSLQLAALTAALNALALGWVAFDGHISPVVWASVNLVLGVLAALARVIAQPRVPGGQ